MRRWTRPGQRLTDGKGKPAALTVLGRAGAVPQAARGAARFDFEQLCDRPLAAADYLAVAQHFHTVLIDHIPVMTDNMHNVARRFTLLIDTLYDEGVKLICSAAAPPDGAVHQRHQCRRLPPHRVAALQRCRAKTI